MFLFQHPEEYLRSLASDRERVERRNRLLRELRGSVPPFGEAQTRRLAAALAETSNPLPAPRERERAVNPGHDLKEVATP